MEEEFEKTLRILKEMEVERGGHGRRESKFLWTVAQSVKPPNVIVEIGSLEGYSTILLAKGSKALCEVYAIDPHTGFSCEAEEGMVPIKRDSWLYFNKFIEKAEVSNVVHPIRKRSEEAANEWPGKPIGLLFIDGSHKYKDVKKDLLLWQNYLTSGAYVIMHDCLLRGVSKVIKEELLNKKEFGSFSYVPPSTFSARYRVFRRRDLVTSILWHLILGLRNKLPKSISFLTERTFLKKF